MKSPKFLIVGALLFGSAVGQADDGRVPPPPPPPPTPHVQPAPPVPRVPRAPRPPLPPRNGSGFNVQINDGKIQISGLI